MNHPIPRDTWPDIPLDPWADTLAGLHMRLQIIGKIRLMQSPVLNHWWEAVFHLTSRGLTSTPVPFGGVTAEFIFDFIDHELRIDTSEGRVGRVPLAAGSVAGFYDEVIRAISSLGLGTAINTRPVEVETAVPFEEDHAERPYDRGAVTRFWRALLLSTVVFERFRSRSIGKSSPVHFFWGSFDLALTRFSGRTAPPHPGGIPNLGDWVAREAYSHEVMSAGFWPGTGLGEAAYYAYAYPEPEGFAAADVEPPAVWSETLREWVLPYEAVRRATDPEDTLLRFLQSAWSAAADLGGWDRDALERPESDLRELEQRLDRGIR